MQVTKGSEYAIRAVFDLARLSSEDRAQLKEIASRMSIPEDFLAKLFQSLNRSGIIKSYRGTKGGYALAKKPEKITLKDVIESVDGPIKLGKGISLGATCPSGTDSTCTKGSCDIMSMCPINNVWQDAQDSVIKKLEKANFKSLTKNYMNAIKKIS